MKPVELRVASTLVRGLNSWTALEVTRVPCPAPARPPMMKIRSSSRVAMAKSRRAVREDGNAAPPARSFVVVTAPVNCWNC